MPGDVYKSFYKSVRLLYDRVDRLWTDVKNETDYPEGCIMELSRAQFDLRKLAGNDEILKIRLPKWLPENKRNDLEDVLAIYGDLFKETEDVIMDIKGIPSGTPLRLEIFSKLLPKGDSKQKRNTDSSPRDRLELLTRKLKTLSERIDEGILKP